MLIDGKKVSLDIKNKIKEEVDKYNVKPGLAVIQIGNDEASNVYIKAKENACKYVGYSFFHIHFDEMTSEEEIIEKIKELNNDDKINGILLQLPINPKYNQNRIINTIDSNKDVDGLTDINCGLLYKNDYNLVPCTPLGIMELLKYYDINVTSKNVVVVGKSNLVGKPIAFMLLNSGATVTICHSKTVDLQSYTKSADILIVAVGKKHLITSEMVKDGAVIIDVGINRVDGKLYGDVDYDNVSVKASYITPVPGGVGPMTVAMLLSNVLKNYKKNS